DRLAALHGGTVSCHSAGPGQGSEFMVRLPALAADGQAPPPDAPGKPEPVPPCHLLIVEDCADSRNVLASLLKLKGHRAEVGESGSQALELPLRTAPQAALTDIDLPYLDGYEVTKELPSPLGARTYLLALTG